MSIRLKGSTDGSVTLQAPADTSPTGTDKTFTLPTQDGNAGQVLKTDGSGALSFTDNLAVSSNLVINGAMRVAQRATSGSTTSGGGYPSVDRWKCADAGEGAFTVSQSSTAPDGFANSVKWDCTTADTSISSEVYMEQLIEGQDLQHLRYGTGSAKSITISFWVRSNLTGQFGVWLENFDSSRYFTTTGYTINTANTWEYKTITIPGDTAGSGFGDDNEVGMKFRWHLAVRSSYQGTPSGSWSASASNRSQSSHVNLASSTANEWYLTGVQVEVGEVATSYEHRSFDDELRKCQRYFIKSGEIGTAGEWFPGVATHAEHGRIMALALDGLNDRAVIIDSFPTTMRAAGSATFYPGRDAVANTAGNITIYNGNTSVTTSSKPTPTTRGFEAYFTGTSTDARAYTLQYTVDSEL